MTTVWIKLYIGQDDNDFSVFGTFRNVDHLKEKIKEKAGPRLVHCAAFDLDVYDCGTTVPVPEEMKPLPLSRDVPNNTEEEKPLIVIAPPRTNQQQQGELRFCRAINDFDLLFHSS